MDCRTMHEINPSDVHPSITLTNYSQLISLRLSLTVNGINWIIVAMSRNKMECYNKLRKSPVIEFHHGLKYVLMSKVRLSDIVQMKLI